MSMWARTKFMILLAFALCHAIEAKAQPLCASNTTSINPATTPHTTKKLDIIWVVDNSHSMKPYQNALSKNLLGWLNGIIEQEVDFQVALLNTDGELVSQLTGEHALNSETLHANREQFLLDFRTAIQVGTEGSNSEKLFDPVVDFLDLNKDTFLRRGSNLTVLFLSDLDSRDASTTPPKRFARRLLELRKPSDLQLFGILESKHRENFEELNSENILPIEILDLHPQSKKASRNVNDTMSDQLKTIGETMASFTPGEFKVTVEIPLNLVPTDTNFVISLNGKPAESLTPPSYDPLTKKIALSFWLSAPASVQIQYSADCVSVMHGSAKKDAIAPEPPTPKKQDILWVIDNSGSMSSYQQTIAQNLASWMTDLAGKGLDFKIAITTTDFIVSSALDGEHALTSASLRKNHDQFFKDFETAVRVGTDGSGTERHFDPAMDFLKNNGKTFLREGSDLSIIFLSDIDSTFDAISPENFIGQLLQYRSHEKLKIFGLLTPSQTAKFGRLNLTEVPIKIFDINASGPQMSAQLVAIGESIVPWVKVNVNVPLPTVPLSPVFELYVNGVRKNSLDPIQYDPVTNSVTVSVMISKDTPIEIRYPVPCDYIEGQLQ